MVWIMLDNVLWKWFLQVYSKKVLKSFNNCYENIELKNGSLKIILHENIWDYEREENKNRQRDFREKVGIDRVAHSLKNNPEYIEVKDSNAAVQFFVTDSNNRFTNGGIKMIKMYYDERGNNVNKVLAKTCIVIEYDEKGNKIYESEEKLI